jgi:HEAT repeat protein
LEPLLLTVKTAQSPSVGGAIKFLVQYDDPRVLSTLREMLLKEKGTGWGELSNAIVTALEQLRSDTAIDVLIEGTRAGNANLRWAAAEALGRLKAAKGLAAIREVMRSSMPDDDAKAVDAVMAVYELGGENARQDVAEFLARQSSGTAGSSAVVRALVITGTAEAAETKTRMQKRQWRYPAKHRLSGSQTLTIS